MALVARPRFGNGSHVLVVTVNCLTNNVPGTFVLAVRCVKRYWCDPSAQRVSYAKKGSAREWHCFLLYRRLGLESRRPEGARKGKRIDRAASFGHMRESDLTAGVRGSRFGCGCAFAVLVPPAGARRQTRLALVCTTHASES